MLCHLVAQEPALNSCVCYEVIETFSILLLRGSARSKNRLMAFCCKQACINTGSFKCYVDKNRKYWFTSIGTFPKTEAGDGATEAGKARVAGKIRFIACEVGPELGDQSVQSGISLLVGNSTGRKIDLYLDSYACFPFGLESAPQKWLQGGRK